MLRALPRVVDADGSPLKVRETRLALQPKIEGLHDRRVSFGNVGDLRLAHVQWFDQTKAIAFNRSLIRASGFLSIFVIVALPHFQDVFQVFITRVLLFFTEIF